MPRVTFVEKNFQAKTLAVIEQANAIITQYQALGFRLTLRQLYYQFVARALIANKQAEYDRLGAIISDARLAGLIDWDALEDRTRQVEKPPAWNSPRDILAACAAQYQEDLWKDQECRVEVWVEKEALVGIIEPACKELRLAYFACRGYSSQSAQYEAGERMRKFIAAGQRVIVLHFGDHDPSGIDMTRDNDERLHMFARAWRRGSLEIRRIALNWEQVEEYSPPPNPAKMTDSRFNGYEKLYGDESWELDALEPTIIDSLIRDEVAKIYDHKRFAEARRRELQQREKLQDIADNFE